MDLLYLGAPLLLCMGLFLSVSGHVLNKALGNELLNNSLQWSPLPENNHTSGVDLWLESGTPGPNTTMSEEIDSRRQHGVVPDEQRLYENLMMGYESSVRPVINASRTIVVSFKLTLNQIIDLDERKQVLTTNVFIDQEWEDENLKWNADHYNGIRTLRVPASYVWLPDTFIFNNADDGSTGFMQGVYVSLNFTGMVLWPVPVKLRSSCKVDITYFPFDDQQCILRFGSWIYSGEWMDFKSSIEDVDLSYYIDNSEWELLSITFQKGVRKYACCPEPHPDLTYTLHIRRRTFFYIFNIIVPCVMLSVLTLLTFWLPTTCGEKISLGLSVFLAFSMFMLLIAEEVPAASESVPLIGIYLTTVMTMTSLSVVMAVLVINIYNRGSKARRAPGWIKVVVLNWMCRFLRMTHDIERLAATIKLTNEEEERYECEAHDYQKLQTEAGDTRPTHHPERKDPLRNVAGTPSSPPITLSPSDSDLDDLSKRFTRMTYKPHTVTSSQREALVHRSRNGMGPSVSGLQNAAMATDAPDGVCGGSGGSRSAAVVDEPVWLPRDLSRESNDQVRFHLHDDTEEVMSLQQGYTSSASATTSNGRMTTEAEPAIATPSSDETSNAASAALQNAELLNMRMRRKQETLSNLVADSCQKEKALVSRKEMIVEWQTIATVIDRLLFWIFLLGTIIAYIVILIVVPGSKPTYSDNILPIHLLKRNS